MELILLVIHIIAIHGLAFMFLLGAYMIQTSINSHTKFCMKKGDSVLVVVSHPNDVCLFFSPTILFLMKSKVQVSILCLSAGNKRIKELINCCKNMGIQDEDIFCLEEFNDHPYHSTSTKLLAQVIKRIVLKVGASAVLTFDDGGISGHFDHLAACKGVRYLRASGSLKEVKFYFLKTMVFFRHFIHVLDIFVSLHSALNKSCILIVASPIEYITAYCSTCHSSQLMWYDYIGILFSRDMLMNTWTTSSDYDFAGL